MTVNEARREYERLLHDVHDVEDAAGWAPVHAAYSTWMGAQFGAALAKSGVDDDVRVITAWDIVQAG